MMSKCTNRTVRMTRETKDSFLGDFLLNCTEQEAVDDSADCPFSDVVLLADDNSLSQYLTGGAETLYDAHDVDDHDAVRPSSSDNGRGSPDHSSPSDDDEVRSISSSVTSGREIIVVKCPQRGNSSSRQALAARENRQRKKQYLSGLEASVKMLSQENTDLKNENAQQKLMLDQLKDQVAYLKNVLANQSTLSSLLKNIQNNIKPLAPSNVSEKPHETTQESSMIGQKRKHSKAKAASQKRFCVGSSARTCRRDTKPVDGDATRSAGTSVGVSPSPASSSSGKPDVIIVDDIDQTDSGMAGVCLHVVKNSFSLEFCATCNLSAAKSSSVDHAYVKAH